MGTYILRKLLSALSWIFAVCTLLTAIIMLINKGYLSAVAFIVIAYFVSPLSVQHLKQKVGISIFFFFLALAGVPEPTEDEAKIANGKNQEIEVPIGVKTKAVDDEKKVEKTGSEVEQKKDEEITGIDSEKAESACSLIGKVIKIADGDTVTILDKEKKQHKIRLAGIDAPELGQPYGKKAKKYLSALIGKKNSMCKLVQT